MNLDHARGFEKADTLLASERAHHAAMRARWTHWLGARPVFWAALLVTAMIAMVAA